MSEILNIFKDLHTGALPLRELPDFLAWLLPRFIFWLSIFIIALGATLLIVRLGG